MRYQLRIDPSIRFADLPEAVEAGGKFVVFPYCISLFFAVTLRRFSPAIFVPQGQSIRAYQKRYNRISLLFGLWGIPWGVMAYLFQYRHQQEGRPGCHARHHAQP